MQYSSDVQEVNGAKSSMRSMASLNITCFCTFMYAMPTSVLINFVELCIILYPLHFSP